MFKWLTSIFKEDPENPHTWDGQYRAFLKGLADKKTPKITTRWSLAYLYTVNLDYGDVSVEVEYNTVRDTWEIETWSREAKTFLFYYDCLNTPPYKAIRFVLDRYGIEDIVNKAVADKEKAKNKSAYIAESVVRKYMEQ
jgi:hypothetical protein